jgi:chromosome segregation ATPase
LKSDVGERDHKLEEAKSKLEDSNSKLQEAKANIERLPSEEAVGTLRRELEEAKSDLQKRGSELDGARAELDDRPKEEEVQAIREELATFKANLETRDRELDTTKSELVTRGEELTTSKARCESLRGDLNAARSDVTKRIEELATVRSEYINVSKNLKQAEADLEKCGRELGDLKVELAARLTDEQVKSLRDETDSIKADLATRDGELKKTETELAARLTDEQVTTLRTELEEKGRHVETLEKDLGQRLSHEAVEEKDNSIRELKQKLSDVRNERDARVSMDMHKSVQERLATMTTERDDLAKSLKTKDDELRVRPTRDQLTAEEQLSAFWKGRCSASFGQESVAEEQQPLNKEHLEHEILVLNATITRMQGERDNARQQEVAKLTASLNAVEADLSRHQKDAAETIRGWENEAELLREQIAQKDGELEDADKEIAHFRAVAHDRKKQIEKDSTAAIIQAIQSKADLDTANSRIEILLASNGTANSATLSISADRDRANERAESARKQTEDLQTRLNSLEKDLHTTRTATITAEHKLEVAKNLIGTLESDVRYAKSDADSATKLREEQTKQVDDLRQRLEDANRTAKEHRTAANELQGKLANAEETATTAKNQATKLDTDLSNTNTRMRFLERDLDRANSKIDDVKDSAEKLHKSNEVVIQLHREARDSAHERSDELKASCQKLEDELRVVRKEATTATTQLAATDTQLTAATERTHLLQAEIRETKAQRDASVAVLQQKVDTLSRDLGEKVKLVKYNADQLAATSTLLLSANELNESLEASTEVANSESRRVKTRLDAEVERAADLQQNVDRLSRELDAAKTKLTAANDRVQSLGTQSSETQTQHASATASLQQDVERLSRERREKAQAVDDANTRIQSLTLEVASANTTARRLEARRYGLQCELKDTSERSNIMIAWQMASIGALESERDRLKAERDQIGSALYRSEGMLDHLQGVEQSLSDVQEEKQRSDDRVASLQAELGQELEISHRLEAERDINARDLAQALQDKQASDLTAASLQTSLDSQKATLEQLQENYQELEASNVTLNKDFDDVLIDIESLTDDVTNLKQVRVDLLEFMYKAFEIVPDVKAVAFIQDDMAKVVGLTKERVRLCHWAWDKIKHARAIISNKLREAQANVDMLMADTRRLSEAHENQARVAGSLQGEVTAANNLLTARDYRITTLTADVAARNERIEALLAAHQTALEEHLTVAVAMEKLKINHSALEKFVGEIVRDEDPEAS